MYCWLFQPRFPDDQFSSNKNINNLEDKEPKLYKLSVCDMVIGENMLITWYITDIANVKLSCNVHVLHNENRFLHLIFCLRSWSE